MPTITVMCLFFGFLLNLTGLVGYFNTNSLQLGILPCALGLILISCGLIACKKKLQGRAIYAALLVGAIGFAATASGFLKLLLVLRKKAGLESPVIISKSTTALLCGLFVARCILFFLQARRAKKQEAPLS